ncbi:hypothetical protein Trydic_g8626 [Trypoxylus dichotomus]
MPYRKLSITCDPFVIVVLQELNNSRHVLTEDLCIPNPCGINAKCEPGTDDAGNDRPVCTCLQGYFGNALTGCTRGECLRNDDCLNSEACINYRCVNACKNMQCGTNAECSPRNHIAGCSCPPGYNGDALDYCRPVYSEPYIQRY